MSKINDNDGVANDSESFAVVSGFKTALTVCDRQGWLNIYRQYIYH